MKTELFISWRYLITKKKEKFISLISIISVLGVAIGVMALIVVISVMSGFDRELRDRIVGNFSHITVSSYQGTLDYQMNAKQLLELRGIRATSPQIQGQIFMLKNNRFFALGLRGIEPDKEKEVSKIEDYLIQGDLGDLGYGGLLIGKELSDYLGLNLNDEVIVYSPLAQPHELKIKGIFYSGMYDYDLNLAFVNLNTAQDIFGLENRVTNIAIKLDNLYLAPKVKADIQNLLGFDYMVRTWSEVNKNFFAALKLEKLTMFIILALIVLVAAFNIISTLVVIVVEKTKDIGILKAIGLSQKGIKRIFTYKGLIIGLMGVGLGAIGGLLICFLLKKYQFVKLPQDIYYIEHLPVRVQFWPDVILIILAALVITLVSTIYPAAKAARLRPAEALRYE